MAQASWRSLSRRASTLTAMITRSLFLTLLSVAALAQTPSLTIQDGFASKNREAGATVHVFARQNTATTVFDRWTGDVQYLLDPLAPYTSFTMPAANVALRATYRTVPSWTARTGSFNNINVTYFVPANPIGLIFHFHGTGGTGTNLFQSHEFLSFTRDLVAAGFAVASFDCLNRTTGQWDTAVTGNTNADIVRLNGIITAMKAQNIVPQDIPLLAFGHSNGGQFSHFSAPVMNWRAVAVSSVQGSMPSASAGGYNGPVMWWMPRNDDHPQVGQAGIATSIQRYDQIANRGILARHIISPATPLYPERWTRSAVLTLADSLELQQIFRTNNWIDANEMLTRNPNEDYWLTAIPARFNDTQRASIRIQLESSYATHEFSNYVPHLIIDHYLRALGRRPTVKPINGASYIGENVAPGAIATIFTEGIAPALTVGANGPQAGLGNVNAVLRSTAGTETPARWFYVSPGQGSFLVPDVTPGTFTLKITSGDRRWSFPTMVAAAAPGIFTANGNGQGVPAAVILRVSPDNTRSVDYPFEASASGFIAAPLRFGDDRLFLDLYATGVRGSTNVQVILGGETITPLFAGAQSQFPGLDQVTFELPRSYASRGRVEAAIVSGGVRSNTVELNFGN